MGVRIALVCSGEEGGRSSADPVEWARRASTIGTATHGPLPSSFLLAGGRRANGWLAATDPPRFQTHHHHAANPSGFWLAVQDGHVPLSLAAEDVAKAVGCMVLSGPILTGYTQVRDDVAHKDLVSSPLRVTVYIPPLLTGYTQTMNDWYDRDLDAINEPYRPIPSGAIKEGEVRACGRACVRACVWCVRAVRSRGATRATRSASIREDAHARRGARCGGCDAGGAMRPAVSFFGLCARASKHASDVRDGRRVVGTCLTSTPGAAGDCSDLGVAHFGARALGGARRVGGPRGGI